MQKPPIPDNEQHRLEALHELGILYTPAEERYDRITRLARNVFGTPTVLITLVDQERQWFKSSQGFDLPETPRDVSFCAHAIGRREIFVVEDAANDERFADNPLVLSDPKIRFYAGHPIYSDKGLPLGTICLIDCVPRALSPAERSMLQDFAALVESEIDRGRLSNVESHLMQRLDQAHEKATIDALTRLWNRDAILTLAEMEISRASRGTSMTVALIDIDGFKQTNDTRGHQAGDATLADVASCIRRGVRDFDAVGRYGGDEFLAILSRCEPGQAADVLDRICKDVAAKTSATITIGAASYGAALNSMHTLIAAADAALYRGKAEGRNCVRFAPFDEKR